MIHGPFPHCSIAARFNQQENQHSAICENCSVPVLILDANGKAVHINDAFKLLWDIYPEKVLSKPGYNVFKDPGLQVGGISEKISSAFAGHMFQCELPEYHFPSQFSIAGSKHLRPRSLLISLIPEVGEDRVLSIYMVYHQESPIRDVKKLQRNCSQLATIASSVHDLKHDLSNPLLLIIGNTQLLLSKSPSLPEDVVAKLEKILNAGERIKTLLEQYHNVTALLDNNREVENLVAID